MKQMVRTASTTAKELLRTSSKSIQTAMREDAVNQREIYLSSLVNEALHPTKGPSLVEAFKTLAAKEEDLVSIEELVTFEDLWVAKDPAAEKKIREFKHAFNELRVTKNEFLKAIDTAMKENRNHFSALFLLASICENFHGTLFYSPHSE